MEKILDKIIRYGLYAMAFLVPIFFWPSTRLPILANKQLLVSLLCGLLLLIWIVKIMVTGKARFKWNKITIAVLLLLLVLGIATVFSTARLQSFLGMAFEADTFLSFILYSLVFLLFGNLIQNKIEVLRTIKAFLAGIGVVAVLFLISTLFGSVFPWDFAKLAGFNTVGMVSALAVLLGGALMIDVTLLAECLKNIKKCRKLTFIAEIVIGVLLLMGLVLINYWATWVVVGLSCLLIVWIKGFKKEAVIPVCLLVLALLFVVLNIPTNKLVTLPTEPALSYQASSGIAKETVFQGMNEFLLGSGPATFVQDYDLFRPLSVNLTEFWQSRFTQGNAVFLTLLATSGVLGLLSMLYLMVAFFYFAFKLVLKKVPEQAFCQDSVESGFSIVKLVLFVGGFYFLIAWLFHSINFTLMFSVFLLLGLWTSISEERTVNFELKNMQPQHSFFIMLSCILLIVLVVVGFYEIGRNYAAALAFDEGVELVRKAGPDLEQGINVLTRAAEMVENDNYYRNLSQTFLVRVNQIVNDNEMAVEPKKEALQGSIDAAEAFASRAIVINPKNSQNWTNLADIHVVLARDLGISTATDLAISSYEQAKALTPNNPLLLYKIAVAYVLSADVLKAQYALLVESGQPDVELMQVLSDRHQTRIEMIVADLQKALQLKPDFVEAAQLLSKFTTQ